MTDEWTEWYGGSRQLKYDELCQVTFRDGSVSTIRPAGQFMWRWNRVARFDDIVSYRVVVE